MSDMSDNFLVSPLTCRNRMLGRYFIQLQQYRLRYTLHARQTRTHIGPPASVVNKLNALRRQVKTKPARENARPAYRPSVCTPAPSAQPHFE